MLKRKLILKEKDRAFMLKEKDREFGWLKSQTVTHAWIAAEKKSQFNSFIHNCAT